MFDLCGKLFTEKSVRLVLIANQTYCMFSNLKWGGASFIKFIHVYEHNHR